MGKIWLIWMPSSPINYIMKKNPVCWFTQGTVVLILINIVRNNDIAVDLGLHNQCRPIATLNCVKYLPHYSLYLAPVPLSIFRSNSKFDENSKHSSVKYTRPITTIFCTRHDSVTVVTCAKYRCDRSSVFDTRAFWIFIEFRIRSKYA